MTDKEAIEIGNIAFRKWERNHPMGGIPYHSKNWKLHIFADENGTEKIAIIDEKKPLHHINYLWSSPPSLRTTHDNWIPVEQYNWIEITKDLTIHHHYVIDLNCLLNVNCQYWIFEKLIKFGFSGEVAEL